MISYQWSFSRLLSVYGSYVRIKTSSRPKALSKARQCLAQLQRRVAERGIQPLPSLGGPPKTLDQIRSLELALASAAASFVPVMPSAGTQPVRRQMPAFFQGGRSNHRKIPVKCQSANRIAFFLAGHGSQSLTWADVARWRATRAGGRGSTWKYSP